MKKLLTNIRRELTLLSRGVYFYVEVAVAAVALIALLVVMPETFEARATEYLFIEGDRSIEEDLFPVSDDLTVEEVEIKGIQAIRYTSDMKYLYIVDSREDLITLCETTGNLGVVLHTDGETPNEFYLQGNETERFKDYILLSMSADTNEIIDIAENQKVRALERNPKTLNDRQNLLPMILTVNCAMMGIFVATAFIVEDKKTKVIKALRVVPSGIGNYLISKMSATLIMSVISCVIIAVPVMGGSANYPLLLLAILCGGFFSVSIGALMASYYNDIANAFGSVFTILIIMMFPCILSIIPTATAVENLARIIPSYYLVQSVKESLLNRDWQYVLLTCVGLLAASFILFPISIKRYKTAGIGA